MCKKIAVIGGDMRMVYLAELLSHENNVRTYGVEHAEEKKKIAFETENKVESYENKFENKAEIKNKVKEGEKYTLNQAIEQSDIIICPTPFSKDKINVFTNSNINKIPINELIPKCKGKTLIAGAISQEVCNLAKENDIDVIDLMQNESIAVLNTIATAEGTIEVAIRKTNSTIHGSNVLIIGYGRVAKVVAQKFAGLNAHITCSARKQEALAWIEANGYNFVHINDLGDNLKEYDIIISTPPTLILDKNKLEKVRKDCLIIDLASNPGGVDRKAIDELGLNFEWALALPGKVAPKTSAKYIKRVIDALGTEQKASVC